jgi:hypothetical protein
MRPHWEAFAEHVTPAGVLGFDAAVERSSSARRRAASPLIGQQPSEAW